MKCTRGCGFASLAGPLVALLVFIAAPLVAPVAASSAERTFEQRMKLPDGTQARVWLDADAHAVTDLIQMTVETVSPAGRVASTRTAAGRLGDLRILAIHEEGPDETESGATRRRWIYTLEPLHGGEVVLRPITIVSADAKGDSDSEHQARSRALTLEVNDPVPAGVSLTNPRDIAFPEEVELRLAWGPITLLVVLVGLLAAAAARLSGPVGVPADGRGAPTVDDAEAALERLASIERQLPNEVSTREWMAIANTLRFYLASRYDLPADRRTSEELAQLAAGAQPALAPHARELGQVLGRCDMGRFSRASSEVQLITETITAARSWVRATVA